MNAAEQQVFLNEHREAQGLRPFPTLYGPRLAAELARVESSAPYGNNPWPHASAALELADEALLERIIAVAAHEVANAMPGATWSEELDALHEEAAERGLLTF